MDIVTQKQRYMPHEISTRVSAVKAYRETRSIQYVCRKYHVSKASLMRWNKRYDGTRESLADREQQNGHEGASRSIMAVFIWYLRSEFLPEADQGCSRFSGSSLSGVSGYAASRGAG